jgi:hypothetical protein
MASPSEASSSAGGPAELHTAERAFERGDFAAVARFLPAQPALSTTGRAAELRAATKVDPAHAAVLGLCLLGFLAIAASYL